MTKKKKKKIRSNTEVIGPKTSPPFIIHFTPLHHILKPWRTHDILRGNIITRETCVQPQAQKKTTCEQSWFNRLRISNIRRGESMPTKTKCAARLLTTSHRISKISQDFLVCTRTISWIHQHFWFFLKNSDQVGRVVLADQIFQTLSNPIRGNTEGGALHVVSGSCSRGSRALLRLDMAGGQRETVRRLHTVGGWGKDVTGADTDWGTNLNARPHSSSSTFPDTSLSSSLSLSLSGAAHESPRWLLNTHSDRCRRPFLTSSLTGHACLFSFYYMTAGIFHFHAKIVSKKVISLHSPLLLHLPLSLSWILFSTHILSPPPFS